MFITFLFAAALMFFILEKKIPMISIAGGILVVFAVFPFSRIMMFAHPFYKNLSDFAGIFGMEHNRDNIMALNIVIAFIFSVVFILIFLFIGRLWGRDLYGKGPGRAKCDLKAVILSFAAIVMVYLADVWLIKNNEIFPNDPYDFNSVRVYNWFLILFGTFPYNEEIGIYYEDILLAVPVLPAALTLIAYLRGKNSSAPSKDTGKEISLLTLGIVLSLAGTAGVTTMAMSNYLKSHWLSEVLFNHMVYNHDHTIFYMVIMFLAIVTGVVLMVIGVRKASVKKLFKDYRFSLVFSLLLMTLSLGYTVWIGLDFARFLRSMMRY